MPGARRAGVRALLALAALSAQACAPRVPPPAPEPRGEVDLVQSVPLETNLHRGRVAEAVDVWPSMIEGAARTIDMAEFYMSDDPDHAGSRLAVVVDAIEAAAKRGVVVRLLIDASFAKKYPQIPDRLGALGNVTVRRFDVGAVMGGVLHAKYFVVDGRDAFLGSQNFDWRSLTHIHEMGVRVRDPAAVAAYASVFALDWELASGGRAPKDPPAVACEAFHATFREGSCSYPETAAGGPAIVTPVMSPKGFLPDPRTWELPRLVALVDGAKRSVHVQVLTYATTARDGSAFPDLDDALRRAAARGVEVRLLVSDWSKKKGPLEAVQRLARVPGASVRFLDIPRWSGGFVPFARVAHAKYMVVDGERAWVGTSNWEGDYFTKSRNVGLVVEGHAFARELDGVFDGAFTSRLAEPVDPDRVYDPPHVAAP